MTAKPKKRIYSNKGDKPSQFDLVAYKAWKKHLRDSAEQKKAASLNDMESLAYVCMTGGYEGKNRTTSNFLTPYGVRFKNLADLADRRGYIFDPTKGYNQIENKIEYTPGRNGAPSQYDNSNYKELADFRRFQIFAVGQLSDDPVTKKPRYFVSGGNTLNLSGYVYSKIFNDDDLYETLKKLFDENMNGTCSNRIYHFADNTLGQPTEV